MTLDDCRAAVAALGFSHTISELDETAESGFLYALNRAVCEVDRLRPQTGVYLLRHEGRPSLLSPSFLQHTAGTVVSLSASEPGACYTFSAEGTGECTIAYGDDLTEHLTWEDERVPRRFCGILPDIRSLTFGGAYRYVVSDIAVYAELSSPLPEDIPDGGAYLRYPLRTILPRFAALLSAPEPVPGGNDIGEYDIEGEDVLLLPREKSGICRLRYRMTPRRYTTEDEGTEELELPYDIAELLPLLIAYYLLIGEDDTLALSYLSAYRERYAQIRAGERNHAPAYVRSVNNW